PGVTVALSVLLLGDAMAPLRGLGIAIVLGAITILHMRRSAWPRSRAAAEALRNEHHLPEMLPGLKQPVRLTNLGQRQHGVDDRGEFPAEDQPHDGLEICQVAHGSPEDLPVALVDLSDVDARALSPRRAADDHASPRPQAADRFRPGRGADRIGGDVDAGRRQLPDPLAEARIPDPIDRHRPEAL